MMILLKYWKPIAVLVVALALLSIGWFSGASHVQAKWDAEHAAIALSAAKQAQHQAEATVKVVTEYVDKIKVVHDKGATIIKEVPVYVPASADADCDIHFGFVRLHDAAATNTIPNPAGAADAAPAGVALSAVAGTVAENYGACHANAQQLIALQGWIAAMGHN
ncbi:MAG: hypothetical protein NTW42_00900 [Deltaproteobacteria bacterium]|nr:hypothetical protein [Deltaproteobacteria bacterium]